MNIAPQRSAEHRQTTSFRKRSWILASVAVLGAVAVPVAVTRYLDRVEMNHAGEALAVAASGMTDEVALMLHSHVTQLVTLAEMVASQEGSLQTAAQSLRTLKEGSAFLTSLAIADPEGRIIAATETVDLGSNHGDSDWFRRARNSFGPEVLDFQASAETGDARMMTLAVAIRAATTDAFRGVLMARLGLPPFEALLARRVNELYAQRPQAGRVAWVVLADDGTVLSDSGGSLEGRNLKALGQASALRSDSAENGYVEEHDGERDVVTGYAHLSGATNAEDVHWRVLLRRTRADVLAPLHRVLGILALVICAVMVPALVGLFVSHRGRERAEEARKLAHTRLQAIVEHARDGMIVTDLDGRIHDFNPAAERLFGWTRQEALGRDLSDLVFANGRRGSEGRGAASFRRAAEEGAAGNDLELMALRRDGQTFPAEMSMVRLPTPGTPLYSATIRDVTARRQLEMELRQAQKLESVGQLAAGVAHEINTPIQFVGDNVRFLEDGFTSLLGLIKECVAVCRKQEAPEFQEVVQAAERNDLEYLEEEIPKALAQTCDGVERVATIVRAMKEFAHSSGKDKEPADLNQAIRSTLTVARNELKYVADVEVELGPLPQVECCVGDLNQVFLNLFVNAAHAIGDLVKGTEQRGTIRVTTRTEGDSVVIAVGDTGGGIPEAVQAKIFDPFFTTKEVGRGSGQGLAIARSIVVDKHGGTLSFETESGRGTTFFVRLPITSPTGVADEPEAARQATG